MFGFGDARAAVEAEGVYVGGWSIKDTFVRQKDASKERYVYRHCEQSC